MRSFCRLFVLFPLLAALAACTPFSLAPSPRYSPSYELILSTVARPAGDSVLFGPETIYATYDSSGRVFTFRDALVHATLVPTPQGFRIAVDNPSATPLVIDWAGAMVSLPERSGIVTRHLHLDGQATSDGSTVPGLGHVERTLALDGPPVAPWADEPARASLLHVPTYTAETRTRTLEDLAAFYRGRMIALTLPLATSGATRTYAFDFMVGDVVGLHDLHYGRM